MAPASLKSALGLTIILALAGCAGMGTQYDTPAEKNQILFTVEAITPALTQGLRSRPPVGAALPEDMVAPEDYTYRIGPTDVLSIFVNQSLFADASAPSYAVDRTAESLYVVSNSGQIFLPLYGPLKVAGLTVSEAYAEIERALSQFITRPQINARVAEYRSQRIGVVGEVEMPGFVPVTDRPLAITEAIVTAGILETADLRKVVLKRKGAEHVVDVYDLINSPSFGQRWVLQDGDVVWVPQNKNKVYVLGEAPNRTAYIDPYNTKLAEILVPIDAQGSAASRSGNYLQGGTALTGSIFVIRGDVDQARVFHLNASSPESLILADEFQLLSGDIVFVSTREITRFNRFVAQLLPSVGSLLSSVLLVDRVDNLGN
jgi:polysaccharide export outer membrane protein